MKDYLQNMPAQSHDLYSATKAALKAFLITLLLLNFISIQTSNAQAPLSFIEKGNATTDSGGCFNLTPAGGSSCEDQAGVIWCTRKVNFNKPFIIKFDLNMYSESGADGADGIDVIFGSLFDTSTQPNGWGGYLGYYSDSAGTPRDTFAYNSFGVEFDTYDDADPYFCDPNPTFYDHAAIAANATPCNFMPGGTPVHILAGVTSVYDTTLTYIIRWDTASTTLTVYINSSCTPIITSVHDYRTMFTAPASVQWGITGATGEYCNDHIICDVTLDTIPTPNDTVVNCGPLTLYPPPSPPTDTAYKWSTGATTPTITVTVSGSYTVTAYSPCTGAGATQIVYDVTINPLPSAITGHSTVCVGDTISLSDITSGGTWSSSNTGISIIGSATGIDNGVSAGVDTTYYTLSTGCYATSIVTVNPLPTAILGPDSVCEGSTVTLSDLTGGGTWSSAVTSVATVGTTTGIVTGIGSGATIISYTLTTGCGSTDVYFIVNAPPLSIYGIEVCVGLTGTLSDGDIIWSSSNTAIATIGSSSGIVTGISEGTATITYANGETGCYRTLVVTVNPTVLPASITGTALVCPGSTTMLSDATGGGTWSSSNTGIATIGESSGIVSGVGAGTTTITYMLGTGCYGTTIVTVNPAPSITGTAICIGVESTLSVSPGGGTLTSSSGIIAVLSSDVIYGNYAGTATLTYTLPATGCFTTTIETVNPSPVAITGTASVCAGSTTDLTDATAGGTWASSNTGIATVGATGIITGVSAGTATITYALSDGCSPATITVTVNAAPVAITGTDIVCAGSMTDLTDTTTSGIWTSSNTGIATVGATGIITGVSAGTATITYILADGCFSTTTITVNPVAVPITGIATVCAGSATSLSDGTTGGTWTSSNTTIATVVSGSGVVTAGLTGTATISYMLTDGCEGATIIVTVYPFPGPITGADTVCVGASITLSDTATGGIWTSGNTAIATIGSVSGVVSETNSGSVTITYTLSGGCFTTTVVTLNPLPLAITGTNQICLGSSATLSDATSDGSWSSSNTSVATIGSGTGVVTANGVGTTTITYTLITGCITTMVLTVNPLPGAITGIDSVCAGSTTALSDSAAGGTWSSSNIEIATVGSTTGIVSGNGEGTITITYTLSTGCYIIATVTVNPLPSVILGLHQVCIGSSIALADPAGGGTWSSSNTGIATISSAGIVTGESAGTVTISYILITGCYRTRTVTVNPIPSVITGPDSVCVGSTITLIDSVSGGTWSSSNTSATIVSSGVVGSAAGIDTIYYTIGDGCFAATTITIIPIPGAITGATSVCAGSTDILSDAVGGGTWSSSNTDIGSVDATGIVTGISSGVITITYSLGSLCIVTTPVTVNPVPAAITGTTLVCVGAIIALSDTTTGGIWSSSNTAIGTVDPTGIVTGISGGTATIIYTLPGGCMATITVTVYPLPAAITGPSSVCIGLSINLNDATTGGTWSSSNTAVGTISISGIVTGITAGTTVITYMTTSSSGCTTMATATITVNSLPSAGGIIGADSVCVGGTTSLYDSVAGGIWSSSNTAVGTVGTLGNVTGVTVGTVIISYTVSNGSCTTTITDTMKVVTTPAVPPITGPDTVCVSATITLSDASTGGVWSSYTTGIANVDPSTGVVTAGSSPGTAIIAYGVSNGCGTTEVLDTITVIPTSPSISGILAVCSGSTDTLGNIVSGGTWTSSNTSIATIGLTTGIVTGIATGTTTITYIATSVCGTFTVTAVVAVNMPPYITTDFIVACQSLGGSGDDGGHTYILTDTSGCILVCDSTTIRYYANGVAGSVFTWAVTGGIIVATYGGDSIDVFWPAAGTTGSIILSDTVSHCIGETPVCFKVIQKPQAYFTASALNVCLGTSVSFTDLSTADLLSPIVSWYWNFGDGTSSSDISPTHTYSVGGTTDTVTLVVKNACNCSDTFRVVLDISATTGPVIECPSIVCDSQSATYSIPDDGCTGSYSWNVIGGAIVSGLGTASIVVDWNAVGSGGFGYVSVVDPCSVCTDTSTIEIPVILANTPISGPDIICANQEYEYTFPLWPATQYMWGVLDDPGAIVGYSNDYKVVVQFSAPGTYTLHGWYQNTIGLCGGNVFKKITVLPPVPIVGNTAECQYETDNYKVGGFAANWTLINDITGAVITTATGLIVFTNTFSTPGVYLLSATGDFCADPLTITVAQSPPDVDSVKGPDTVCLGRVYTYTAYSNLPGTIFNWQAIGGTVSPASGSATVNVTWTAGGSGMQLLVNRVSTAPPYCAGLPTTMNIMQEVINPNIIGDTAPCANSYRGYSTTYTRGEVYQWSIYPNTAGSVVSGSDTLAMNVLWNNVTGTSPLAAAVVLTVHKCDSIVSDTFNVLVQPSPGVTLTGAPDPGCPGSPITFTSAVGGISYAWDFGDGSGLVTTASNTTTHSFPPNITTSNISYVVNVTVLPNTAYSCPLSGVATFIESILPGPVAYASDGSPWVCGGASTTLVGTATDNVGALTYQWYGGSGAISGATGATYSTTSTGTYSFKVTAGNGCSDTSNGVLISTDCPGGGDGCHTLTATTSTTCNVITLTGITTGGTAPSWQAVTPTSGGATIFPGMTVTVAYNNPGIYGFYFHETFDTCTASAYETDTIGVVANFDYELHCADSTIDSVVLEDHTAYLPGWIVNGFTWSEATLGFLGSGPNLHTAFAAPGTYVVTEVVTGYDPDSAAFSCSVTYSINVPAKPSGATAQFTFSVSPVCSTVPISFTPAATGIVGYNWNFGDLSSSLLEDPQRAYTYNGPSNYIIDTVTLTVVDSIGCTADTFAIVQIQENLLTGNGNIGPLNQMVCSNDVPVTLTFVNTSLYTVSSYLWSTGATTSSISVSTSGAYWVTVVGSFQCQATLPSPVVTEVEIINTPVESINGQQTYCYGQTVKLSCYAGAGVAYQWYVNGAGDGTASSVADAGLTPGSYLYQLVLSVIDSATGMVICTDTAADSVYIYPLPPPPVITGPVAIDCSSYLLQLTATEAEPGFYNWSDGTTGAVDNINTGGSYEVWFTDLNGCVSNTTAYVPLSTDFYMQYFPVGCYDICRQQLPLTLYGPPDELFHPWRWLRDGTVVSAGDGLMSPYAITEGGRYRWSLNNGLCADKSGIMDVTIENCNNCGKATLNAKMACQSGNPASYEIFVNLYSPAAGTTFVLGTNMGPIDPFSGTLPAIGPYALTLTFTTLALPPPDSVEVEVMYTLPDGTKCFQEVDIPVPACNWVEERVAGNDSTASQNDTTNAISTALLVFPNPASGSVTISYDYGTDTYNDRSLSVFDEMGRKIQNTIPPDVHGNWNLNTTDWMPGVYIIRMEGNGQALQTQRMVISH